ncbi:unnamed protein product, partial [Allacma fusca]
MAQAFFNSLSDAQKQYVQDYAEQAKLDAVTKAAEACQTVA